MVKFILNSITVCSIFWVICLAIGERHPATAWVKQRITEIIVPPLERANASLASARAVQTKSAAVEPHSDPVKQLDQYEQVLVGCGIPGGEYAHELARLAVDFERKTGNHQETLHRLGKVCLHSLGDTRALSDNSW